jgi:tetratricopeptide (TPR) repeat protein
MMPRKLLLVLAIAVLAASCNRDPQAQAVRFVENGNKFYEKAKYKEASIMYRRALQRDLRNGDAYYRLGLTDIKLGLYGDAVRVLHRAVELQPKNTDAAVKLADIYMLATSQDPAHSQQLLKEVKDLSDRLLQQDANFHEGHRLRGQLGLLQNDPALAVKEFETARKLMPGKPEYDLGYFQALAAAKRMDEAEEIGKSVLAKNKNYAPMYDLLYVHYMGQNRIADAEAILKDKVANNTKQSNFLLQLASHYLITKQRPQADAVLARLNDEAQFPDGHLLAGDFLFFRAREFELAKQQYEAGIKAFPRDRATYQKRLVELLASTGRSQEANETVAAILKDNEKDDDARAMKAALQLQTGDLTQISQATSELQSLVAKTPENHLLRFNLARAYMAKNDMDQARLQLESAIKIRPDFVVAKETLAALYLQKGDAGKALKEADEAIGLNANDLAPRLVRSSALLLIGDKDKARQELDNVLRMAPNNPDARYQVGFMAWQDANNALKAGKAAEAGAEFKRANELFGSILKSNPKDIRGLVGVVETMASQKQFPEAIKTVEAAVSQDPKRNDMRTVLANLYARSDRYDDAIKIFSELSKSDPRNGELLIRLAEAQRRKGDINTSIETFRQAAQVNQADIRPLLQLGLMLDGTGRRDQAKPIYEQVLKIDPDQPIALNNLAFIKAEEGVDLDVAMTMAQKARQKLPGMEGIKDTLGWIYVKKNLADDAIQLLKDAIKSQPNNASFRYHYGVALLQKGNRPEAKRELETAASSNPAKEDATKIQQLLATL